MDQQIFNDAIKRSFQILQEEDPVLDYNFGRESNGIMSVRFYYHGHFGSLLSHMVDGIHHLEDKEKNILIKFSFDSKNEEVEKAVRHYFREIYNSIRIGNLYDPPKLHFKQCTSKMGLSQEIKTEIYDKIKARYDGETIERELAKQWRSNKENYLVLCVSHNEFNLIRLLDFYFIVVQSTNGTGLQRFECFDASQGKKAMDRYELIIDGFVNEEKQKNKENIQNLYNF